MKKLIAIGEALIDFIPKQKGVKLKDVQEFERHCGGAPANVAAAFAYLGGKASMLTKLGMDAFGDAIIEFLQQKSVDTSLILRTDLANTSLAFVSLDQYGDRDFAFYRQPGSDMLLDKTELKKEWFDGAILHFCSVNLVECPTKYAHIDAINYTKNSGGIVSFDPNLRFPLWKDKKELKSTVLEFCKYADIIKVSDEEANFLFATDDYNVAAKKLMDMGAKIAIVTLGASGAFAMTKDTSIRVDGFAANVVDTTGAGDIFIGSFLYFVAKRGIDIQHIDKTTLNEAITYACKASSLSVEQKGASFDRQKLINYFGEI